MKKVFLVFLIFVNSDDGEVPISGKIRDQIIFEFDVNGYNRGFITIGLFTDIVPKTVKNFIKLSTSTHYPSYQNTIVHRISSYMIQLGDVEYKDGNGGTSSFKKKYFADENFDVLHYRRGYVAMSKADGKPDTNGSQFYITTKRTSWLDNEYVVFGKVIDGWDVVKSFTQEPTDSDEKPTRRIRIIGAVHKKLTKPRIVNFPSELEASYEEDEPEEKDDDISDIDGDTRDEL